MGFTNHCLGSRYSGWKNPMESFLVVERGTGVYIYRYIYIYVCSLEIDLASIQGNQIGKENHLQLGSRLQPPTNTSAEMLGLAGPCWGFGGALGAPGSYFTF